MAGAQPYDLLQLRRKLLEPPSRLQALDRAQLSVRSTACAHDVRVIRVCEPVGPRARRGDDGIFAKAEGGIAGSQESEELRDRVGRLRVGDRVAIALVDRKGKTLLPSNPREERRGLRSGCAQLEVRVRRAGHGARREQRTAEIGRATAGARNDPFWRPLQRDETRIQDTDL